MKLRMGILAILVSVRAAWGIEVDRKLAEYDGLRWTMGVLDLTCGCSATNSATPPVARDGKYPLPSKLFGPPYCRKRVFVSDVIPREERGEMGGVAADGGDCSKACSSLMRQDLDRDPESFPSIEPVGTEGGKLPIRYKGFIKGAFRVVELGPCQAPPLVDDGDPVRDRAARELENPLPAGNGGGAGPLRPPAGAGKGPDTHQ